MFKLFDNTCPPSHSPSIQPGLFKDLIFSENWHGRCLAQKWLLCLEWKESVALLGMCLSMAAIERNVGVDLTKALVISAYEENRAALSEALAAEGFVPALCSSMTDARKLLQSDDIGIVFCDDCVSDGYLKNVVAEVDERREPIPVIAVSRTGEWHEYLEALRMGAFDYLSLPPRRNELCRVLASALSKESPTKEPKLRLQVKEVL